MFNDLMVELKDKNFISLAYADDLAIIGYNKGNLKEKSRTFEREFKRKSERGF